MTDTDLQRRLTMMLSEAAEHPVDTGRGWRELQLLRTRARRNRRRGAAAVALAVVAVAAVAVPILAGGLFASRSGRLPIATRPAAGRGAPPPYRTYPGAVAARIPLGGVVNLAQDGTRLWAVRGTTPFGGPGNTTYQLVRIDLRTEKVTLRVGLGSLPAVVAAAGGTVWRTTPNGQAAGQVVRIDPATGKVITTLHLAAGWCGYLSFAAGQLWAECGSGRWNTVFLRLNPVTGRVQGTIGPVRGPIGRQAAIAPGGVWYSTNYAGISGTLGAGSSARVITVRDPSYPASFVYTQSLVYSQGALWVLTGDESVAKIDPATGRVVRVYTIASYDPTGAGGLDFLTVGQGSLWFLDDGYLFSGVLRVSTATGKPLGGITIPSGSCGQQPCWQIYDTQNAVWVPTQTSLIRIDPARLPG